MQVKALLYKVEPVFAHDPETLLSALGKSEIKMDSGKVKNCSLVRQIKIWNFFWKTWTSNKGLSGLLSVLGSKTCNSDGTWMHQFLWNCQLTHFKKQHHCWRVYTSFRATSIFSEVFVYLSTMKINHALQRLQQHDFIGEEIRCWSEDLSPAENIWHTMTGKMWQKRPSTMWPYFSLKCPAAGLLRLWAVVKRRLDATEWWKC